MKTITCTAVLIAVMLSGCYEPRDPRIQLREEVRGDSLGSNIVTRPIGAALSALIGEGLDLGDVKTFRNESGFMEAHISVYNRAVATKRFEYRVEWLDVNGVVIDSAVTTWLPFSVMGKSTAQFRAVAPRQSAVNFRVNTRKQR